MTARATKSALELVGEFLFGSTRQVRPKKHPIEHLPLPFSKRASFFSPVRHRARTDCVFRAIWRFVGTIARGSFFLSSSHRKKTAVSKRSSSSLTPGLAPIAKMFCCTAWIAAFHDRELIVPRLKVLVVPNEFGLGFGIDKKAAFRWNLQARWLAWFWMATELIS
jgi:hypothetical protein